MAIISLQSHVVYGRVGNRVAVPAMERLGHEVWPINTVQFSSHAGYPGWQGRAHAPDELRALLKGLSVTPGLKGCGALLSGYLGSAALGEVVVEAVEQVKAENPKALYLCDPVMGDDAKGLYVQAEIPNFIQSRLLGLSDILTPNTYELGLLVGDPIDDREGVIQAAQSLLESAPNLSLIVVTSVEDGHGNLGALAVERTGALYAGLPILDFPAPPHGTGDLFAALFLAHFLSLKETALALEWALSGLYGVLRETSRRGSGELCYLLAQDDLLDPPVKAEPERVA